MPFYIHKGSIPPKRHTVFKNNNKLAYEQHVSREGFSGIYSNMYHISMPTRLSKVGNFKKITIKKALDKHQTRHLKTFDIKKTGNAIDSRVALLFNDNIIIIFACCIA